MLALLCGVHSLDSLVRLGIAPLSPFIMSDLGINKGSFGLLSSAIRLSGIPLAVAAGVLVDRIGIRRAMVTVGIAVTGVMSLFVLPLTYAVAFMLFFLTGASISLISPLGNAGIMRWFPVRERGLAFGLKQMGMPMGGALAALILPPLALNYDWQLTFAGLGVTVGVVALGSSLVYRDPPGTASTSDRQAAFQESAQPTRTRPPRGTALAVLRTPGVALLVLTGSSFAAMQMSILSFLVPFFEEAGLTVVAAGADLGLFQVAGMVARPIAGVVSDRALHGRRKGVLLGLIIMVVCGVIFMALATPSLDAVALGVTVVVVGASTMAWAGVFFASTLERAGTGALGTASGVASTANMIGSLVGVPLFGFIVDLSSFTTAFVAFTAWLGLVGVVLMTRFRDLDMSQRT